MLVIDHWLTVQLSCMHNDALVSRIAEVSFTQKHRCCFW